MLVTADTALRHQQNLRAIGIAVILITRTGNRIHDLRPLIPRILDALDRIECGAIVEITR